MLWWSSVGEPLTWTAGVVVFFIAVRWLLLDYVLDTLGPPPGKWPPADTTTIVLHDADRKPERPKEPEREAARRQ